MAFKVAFKDIALKQLDELRHVICTVDLVRLIEEMTQINESFDKAKL